MTLASVIQKPQQFLSFFLSSSHRAMLLTQQLIEILSVSASQIVPVPDTSVQVMGVCNWRGEVLWLVDLGYLLGAEPLSMQRYHYSNFSVVVVHHQGYTLGLVVEQASQMFWCHSDQFQMLPSLQQSQITPCLQGYWLSPQGETLLVLDGVALVDYFRQQSS